jgi:hypothetical protein
MEGRQSYIGIIVAFIVGGCLGAVLWDKFKVAPWADANLQEEISYKDSLINKLKDSIRLSDEAIFYLEQRDSVQNAVIDNYSDRVKQIKTQLNERTRSIDTYTPADIREYLQREGLPIIR